MPSPSPALTFQRQSKSTLTPVNLGHGDTLVFTLADGRQWEMTLLDTSAGVIAQTNPGGAVRDRVIMERAIRCDIAAYAFMCNVRVNGREMQLRREVGTQESFYEPWNIDGVHVWFDAAACAFAEDGGFMLEKDWRHGWICQPARKARFVVHEVALPVCPERMRLWCPLPKGRVDIRDCYNGEDCWMGSYSGAAAHCGLDINMPAGTVLTAPISFDDQYLFNSVAAGDGNNRWRGIRRWPDGSQWTLQCHHQVEMLIPERTLLAAGTPYATGAGTAVGSHEHSHFMFRVTEQSGDYLLDPWILFWQMLRDRQDG